RILQLVVRGVPTCSCCRTPGRRPEPRRSAVFATCLRLDGPTSTEVSPHPESACCRTNLSRACSRCRTNMGTVNVSPLGLGWPLVPFGSVIALSHSGAWPGGVAILVVVPEKDLVFAAFGNDMRALVLHDRLLLWLLREYLHVEVPDLVTDSMPVNDLTPYAGTYRSNQVRVDVSVV